MYTLLNLLYHTFFKMSTDFFLRISIDLLKCNSYVAQTVSEKEAPGGFLFRIIFLSQQILALQPISTNKEI